MLIDWIEKYLTEAETMIYERKVEEGLALLNKLLYEEPGYGSLHNHLGWAYFYHTADVARAEKHFRFAIKFDPEFAAPYQHLGTLYSRAGRYQEAVETFQKGLTKMNANRSILLEGIANAYELNKEYAKAIRSYKEAIASDLGFDGARFSEGIKRCRKKRWALMFNF